MALATVLPTVSRRRSRLPLVLASLLLAAQAHADPRVMKKVPPDFPQDALRRNVLNGVVKTKVSIDGDGNVTGVQVLEASPPPAKVFNSAATEALMKWKFEGSGKPDSAEVKLVFSME